jgi:RNA polymerase sigma factor (sigma-70 family)
MSPLFLRALIVRSHWHGPPPKETPPVAHDPIALVIARANHKAKRLAGRGRFAGHDPQDIAQQLILDVLPRIERFDASRGASLRTFISRLMDNAVARLLEHHSAACRDGSKITCSLDEQVKFPSGARAERGAIITDDRARAHAGGASPDPSTADLRLDLARVMQQLTALDRDICRCASHSTISDVARELGVSRTVVHARLRFIRATFQKAGLDKYLRNSRHSFRPVPVCG